MQPSASRRIRGLALAGLAACLLIPAAGLAGGDSGLAADRGTPAGSAPAGPLQDPDLACDGSSVATVVGLSGAVQAQAPGQAPRSLACDDVVRACETLITSPGGRVGLLTGEVLAQVGTDTRVAIGGGDGVDLFLHRGRLRLIDGGLGDAAGQPFRVGTPHATVEGAASDSELRVGAARTAASTRACSHDGSLQVSSGDRGARVEAGHCSVVDGRDMRSEVAGEPGVGLPMPLECGFEVAAWRHLSPGDVAAPPIGFDPFPGVDPADRVERQPCEIGGCAVVPQGAPGPGLVQGGITTTGGTSSGPAPLGAPGLTQGGITTTGGTSSGPAPLGGP